MTEPDPRPRQAGMMSVRSAHSGPPPQPSAAGELAAAFWAAGEVPPPADSLRPSDRLPPSPVRIGEQDLAEILTPLWQAVMAAAGRLLPRPLPKTAPAAGELRPRAAGPMPAQRRASGPGPITPANAGVPPTAPAGREQSPLLPPASFRSMDWEALAAYCRQHLPDPGDAGLVARWRAALWRPAAADTARRLRDALLRWQRILQAEAVQAVGSTRMTTMARIKEAHRWCAFLEECLPPG